MAEFKPVSISTKDFKELLDSDAKVNLFLHPRRVTFVFLHSVFYWQGYLVLKLFGETGDR